MSSLVTDILRKSTYSKALAIQEFSLHYIHIEMNIASNSFHRRSAQTCKVVNITAFRLPSYKYFRIATFSPKYSFSIYWRTPQIAWGCGPSPCRFFYLRYFPACHCIFDISIPYVASNIWYSNNQVINGLEIKDNNINNS